MRQTFLLLGVLFFVGMLSGCTQQTAEEKLLGHWENIVNLLSNNKTDIAKASAAVKDYVTANIANMKDLAKQFGKDTGKNILKDQGFILRVKKVRESVTELEKKYPVLVNDPQVVEALAPLSEIAY
jgi:hypothetical protein